jgi:hypothetical protein
MPKPAFRVILNAIVLFFAPAALFAADTNAAMLYENGTIWVNGGSIPNASAIFSGDLIQTKADSVASINAPGSLVTVQPDSLIQFQATSVKLEHGEVRVSTSKAMSAQAGEVSVTPASSSWTDFAVKHVDGRVEIAARKGDLLLKNESGTTTLAEGQQATLSDSAASTSKKKGGGAAIAAKGPISSSLGAYVAGGLAAGSLTTWVLIQGDDPISPSQPRKSVSGR